VKTYRDVGCYQNCGEHRLWGGGRNAGALLTRLGALGAARLSTICTRVVERKGWWLDVELGCLWVRSNAVLARHIPTRSPPSAPCRASLASSVLRCLCRPLRLCSVVVVLLALKLGIASTGAFQPACRIPMEGVTKVRSVIKSTGLVWW
jgi:hypothetical protein